MRLPWITLIALTLATPAAAQMAYRYVFPDGRVVYSDRPVPGAQAQSPIAPAPPPADPAPASAAAPAANPEPAPAPAPAASPAPASAAAPAEAVPGARWPPPPDAAQPMPVAGPATAPAPERAAPAPAPQPGPDRIAMLAATTDEVRAAERNLAAANASLEAGREPLPGERTGLARGGSRLNESYWNRQRQLESVVADAQARLDRAVAERNAVR